ncbi:cob(I)yrinic acid a,c-diamide adenosyltransferase [Candidatus Woesearchaeota archaeon]|nr:cob(I)yrinic acid a,c-diamide adenosyltransferase [Candidatus Woesearchaeota archaeon]
MKKGLIHVITGDGKGKTTASVGLAVRAAGFGTKVLYAQLFKEEACEVEGMKKLGITYLGFSSKHPYFVNETEAKMKGKAAACTAFVKDAFLEAKNGYHGLFIIDELGPALAAGMIESNVVLALVKDKPESLELVMTGRNFPEEVLAIADYISEVNKIRHPYDEGVLARKGIEY